MKRYSVSFPSICSVALLAATVGACGDGASEADFSDYEPAVFGSAENAELWADTSAPNIYSIPILLLAAADITAEEGCPVRVEDGSTTTFTGGCTDSEGNEWHGEAVSSEGDGGFLTFDGFGATQQSEDCGGSLTWVADGTMTVTEAGSRNDFSVDLVMVTTGPVLEDCQQGESAVTIEYDGTFVIDDATDEEIWNGSGRFAETEIGVATITTTDEVRNESICETEALYGTTRVESDGHTLTITYDGASDCSPDSTVRWAIDGVDQGELTGVTCSAGKGTASDLGLLLCVLAFVALSLRRRRSAASS